MSDVAKRLEKADKYLQKGKIEDALEELLRANHDDPSNEQVAQKAADLCVSLNRNQDATRLLAFLFDQQAGLGDMAKANITYKKLQRFTTPTPDQTYRWAQFTEKTNKKEAIEASVPNVELTWRLGSKEIEESKIYADHMLALKQIKRIPDFATFIDTSFVDAVKPT